MMDLRQIMDVLPHRYPFLLIDRIVEHDRLKRIVATKCVSGNEPFFQGHFPGLPVMPGVLIIEALAQTAAVLILSELEDRRSKVIYFTGIDECRFRRTVVPGDLLRLQLDVLQLRPRAARMHGVATVDGDVAAEATIFSIMGDR
ncbi:MAG: 3-hydroxyacyl-ACP dehydratase FabZ [Acidobacteria bacterium]|nr:3-hydroxyacyl-ACP dehydratase FabZ [Acidobacteriota bacterium]